MTSARHAKRSSSMPRHRRIAGRGIVIGMVAALSLSGVAAAVLSSLPTAQTASVTAATLSAPTGGAQNGTATGITIPIKWTAPAGYTPTHYTVLRCTGSSCTPSTAISNGTCSGSIATTSCTDTDSALSPSTTYTYAITASFNSWLSPASTAFQASTAAPQISLSPTANVTVGQSVNVTGSNFLANKTVTLSFDGAGVSFSATTNGSGAFGPTAFTVPQAVAGIHTVGAAAFSGYATATLTVVPKITVNAGSGVAGTTASVSGTGFAAGVTPTATFNGSGNPLALGGPGNANTDTFGAFNDATFTIPSLGAGSYTLAVTAGTGDTANFSFAVVSATGYTSIVSFTTTQTSGTMSGLVTVSGSGPNKNEALEVYVDGIDIGQTVNTGSNKSFGGSGGVSTFGLPAGIVSGTHLVTVIDTTGKVDGTATLSLTSVLTASPTSGAPGTSVTVTGTGTGSIHTMNTNGVTFSTFFDSTALATGGTSTTNGATSSSFTVPSGWGTHLVYLEATSGTYIGYYTPAVSFTVPEPTMTATPTGGFVSGHTVTLAGSGFANTSVLSATYAGSSVTLSGTTTTTATGGIATGTPPTFTLPTESAGNYPLTVTDSKGNSFTVGIIQTG